jgi:hypothetical protein
MPAAKQDLASFIGTSFRSVWDLEVLCHLHSTPQADHPPAQMVAHLRASEVVVANSVAALLASGLIVLTANGSARYAPATCDLDHLCAAAVQLYKQRPDAVRRMIVTGSAPGISAFADAFRLRKE